MADHQRVLSEAVLDKCFELIKRDYGRLTESFRHAFRIWAENFPNEGDGQKPIILRNNSPQLQISLVFGWSSMSGSLAFASAGTEQGISYAARRLKPLRWWGIGLAFGGSDVSAASA